VNPALSAGRKGFKAFEEKLNPVLSAGRKGFKAFEEKVNPVLSAGRKGFKAFEEKLNSVLSAGRLIGKTQKVFPCFFCMSDMDIISRPASVGWLFRRRPIGWAVLLWENEKLRDIFV